MASTHAVLRYTAFSKDPLGGNPAGVVLDAAGLTADEMQRIAARVGFSETAFLWPDTDGPIPGRSYTVRYFSPVAEVDFCGHATIASGVALAELTGTGPIHLSASPGPVPVDTTGEAGAIAATLTSVPTGIADVRPEDLEEALATLGWSASDLDPELPPRIGYAGAHHLILAARTRERLARLDYDFDRLNRLMSLRGWTTTHLVWRESASRFHARDPFPVGGVVEDPATGAAAAAFGGYLRDLGLVELPATFTITQGEDMGRPSTLVVSVTDTDRRVRVQGSAVRLLDE
jgi:PhzF family phenazine biosynthesis protein